MFELASPLPFAFELDDKRARSVWQRWRRAAKTGERAFEEQFFLSAEPAVVDQMFGAATCTALVDLRQRVEELALDANGLRVVTASLLDSADAVLELADEMRAVVAAISPERAEKNIYRRAAG